MGRISTLVVAVLAALVLLAGGLFAYLAPGGSLAAQTLPGGAGAEARGITVIAEGSASARPDQAVISAGANVIRPTATEAMAEASRVTEAILKKLDELGIPRANVQTTGVNVFPVQEGAPRQPGAEPPISGYRAMNQLTVLIAELDKVGPVLDGVIAAGANQVGGVRFGLRDDSALRAQAVQEAIKVARPRADAMAAGFNLKAGDVLAVREEGLFSAVPVAEAGLGKGGDVPIEAGQLTVRARVQVTFALAPLGS